MARNHRIDENALLCLRCGSRRAIAVFPSRSLPPTAEQQAELYARHDSRVGHSERARKEMANAAKASAPAPAPAALQGALAR